MNEFRRWQRRARAMIAGAIAMMLLWPCVALVRATTAHDWYAAAKLTVAEAAIAAGFSPDGSTPYRTPDGTIHEATRLGVVEYDEPIEARERIFYTALVGTFHGGLAGALWIVLWVMCWRVVGDPRNRGAGCSWRARDRGLPQTVESWDPPGIAEPLPEKVAGDGRIALWVLSASQAAWLMKVLGAVKNRRAIPVQPSPERANTTLLPAADTAGAAADSAGTKAEYAGTKAEYADTKPKNADAVEKKRRAKGGDGGKARASSDPPAPDSEDGLAELDDGGNVNWL